MAEIDAGDIAIEDLLDHGIHARDVRELVLAGFDTCNMIQSKECLSGIKAITDGKAEEIWKASSKLVADDVRKKEVFHKIIEDLKLELDELAIACGKKGAVLILEDEGAEIEFILPFPSDKEVKWANLSFKTENENEKEGEDLICAKLEKAKWEMESKIFQRYVQREKDVRVKKMSTEELADLSEILHALVAEVSKQFEAKQE